MKRILHLFIILTAINGCTFPYDDMGGYRRSVSVGGGDELILTDADTSTYHYFQNGDSIMAKGCFLKFHKANKVDTFFIWQGTIVIEPHINKLVSDSNFILVEQTQLNHDDVHLYWIISKRTKDIYGPYTKAHYIQKRKDLGVSNKLQFNWCRFSFSPPWW